ncbi:5'-nucleotidase C-terminal domain-containing protein [Domibacillus sp. A3M-37]|uniref:5'-nucleotidase C-terminal domain-containing protein n=1 Tax=Domibacillus sp. A3M-37 TaxID=2962037 RepID=UPI0020B78B73|nr:5'-nucleotidase C-terminal domain-containing protein [Domibacillus sp. A3M-37]MCP3761290.1 5'-nucleotidase C-terminal domain-containing protein [Domibacillus sp. A3M-37]
MKNKHKFIAAAAVASVSVSAVGASAASNFTDVPAKYEEAVQFLTENEITAGYSGSTFGTSMSITRVDAAIQLARALGFTDDDTYEDAGFTDVPERGQWAVNALAESGITAGKAEGKFGAFEPITRGEASYWLANAYSLDVDETVTETPFTDVNERFGPYVNALVESGLSLGKSETKFGAADKLLRGEWALFLYRGAQLPGNFLLSLIHTNDTHAHIDNAARKATVVEALREENPSSLLVDAGDVFSGTLYFNEFKGQADLEFMNLLGYDAMTFGNHEFDLGTEPLAAFIKNAKFPFVSANMKADANANLSSLMNETVTDKPVDGKVYNGIIKEVDGEKVGIFGLTTAETKTISSPGDDVVFEDYIEEAEKAIASFKAEGVNKIVALSHIGFQDGGGDNDVTLAKEVEGIDVIVGGHSHDKLDEPYIDETGTEPTVIVQANEYNKFVGTLDVMFDEDGMVTEYAGELIEVDAQNEDKTYVFEENQEVKNILATKYTPAIEKVKAQVVGSASAALDGERANVRTKETDLGNLITDAMLAKAKTIDAATVIALQNGGGIRASINAGDITMEEVLTVMPFGNALAIMDLTGAEIKAALEHSVSLAPEQNGAFLQAAGLKFTYDSSKAAGSRVTSVQVNEGGTYKALDETKTYAVATNTFTAKGGDNYAMFKTAYEDGRVSEPGFVDWETFTEYLAANPKVDASVEGRITDTKAAQ